MQHIKSSTIDKVAILAAKRASPPREGQRDLRQADTSKLKGEIDQLALRDQLYGLTQEEIEIVEGKK